MTTESQIAANRRNALKSTGPKTAAGKAKVAGNALRHGLTAREVVRTDENQAGFEQFFAEIRETLDPADAVEEQMVERIALCYWRLRRAAVAEAALYDCFIATEPLVSDTEAAMPFYHRPDCIATLSRYEAALDQSLRRATAMLERRQARRRGEVVPAPLEVLVDRLDEGRQADDSGPFAREPDKYETKPILAPAADRADP